ncbi:MAG: hypothetical protein IT522_03720 [Burkholderiales bacterium]|nr:hypothetical protein [Burkholderiales bacterium]
MTLSDTIDEALSWRLRLTADALGTAAALDALVTGLTLIAAAAIAGALWHPLPAPALAFLAAQIALGLVAKWLAIRVRFDAALFAALTSAVQGSGLRTEHLDRALRGVGILRSNQKGRDWDTRCRGALAVLRALGVVAVIQGLLFVSAAIGMAAA